MWFSIHISAWHHRRLNSMLITLIRNSLKLWKCHDRVLKTGPKCRNAGLRRLHVRFTSQTQKLYSSVILGMDMAVVSESFHQGIWIKCHAESHHQHRKLREICTSRQETSRQDRHQMELHVCNNTVGLFISQFNFWTPERSMGENEWEIITFCVREFTRRIIYNVSGWCHKNTTYIFDNSLLE